mgnify:CR=1 FL=1
MTISIFILFAIIGIATILFVTEIFTIDKTAFLVMVSLIGFRIIDGNDAIKGFSNPAVITIMALMIISAALESNGSIKLLAKNLIPLLKKPLLLALPIIMLIVGSISAFISTTAVVIIFVKIMPTLSKKYNIEISKYMMPISFAGILGGSCTLMGTSTNLIVNQIAVSHGIETFTFFKQTPLAFLLLVIGVFVTTCMAVLFLRVIPNKRKKKMLVNQENFISMIKIKEGSSMIGKQYRESYLYKDEDSRLLQIRRQERILNNPSYWVKFRAEDILVIRSNLEKVIDLKKNPYLEAVYDAKTANKPIENGKLIEILVLPGSKLVGKSLVNLTSYDLDSAVPIALHKHKNILNTSERLIENRLSRVRIDVGDRLLVELDPLLEDSWTLQEQGEILSEITQDHEDNTSKYLCLLILLGVILFAASGLLPILSASLLGVAAMLLTRCISLEYAYDSVNWSIIFMLACLLPLGTAMDTTGASEYISKCLMTFLSEYSPSTVLSMIFFITMMISSVISNNATAIVVTPIAISIAAGFDLNPAPFLIVVMLGANFSFFTPIGYQTNTIVYSMGIYRFKHFLLVGGALSFVLWIAVSLLTPIIFPF